MFITGENDELEVLSYLLSGLVPRKQNCCKVITNAASVVSGTS